MATSSLSPSSQTSILYEAVSPRTRGPHRAEMSGTDAYEFIRTCLSSPHRPEPSLQPFLEPGIDWALVQQVAARHRVLPLLYSRLENRLGDRLPPSLRKQIQKHRRGVQIRNTFLIQELGRITQHFEEADLPFLTMKGPVLAHTAFGDIALRHSVDMDLVIPADRFSEVAHLLRTLGYEYAAKRKPMKGWRKTLSLYLDGQWEFARGNTFTLDVHTRIMPPGYSFPADFQQFWERSRPIRLRENVTVPGFSPEDRALILAHHGVKNQWRALRHVADIAGIIRGADDFEWPLLVKRAQDLRTTRILKLGLYLAHDLLSLQLPKNIQDWVQEAPVPRIGVLMSAYLRNRHQKDALTYGERVQLQLLTKDTFSAQLRYGAHSLLQHLWSRLLRP